MSSLLLDQREGRCEPGAPSSQGTWGETVAPELTFLQGIFRWKMGKQNVPVSTGSLSLILPLLLNCFLNTLLPRVLQGKVSRVCFSEVTRKPRLTGLLLWLRSHKLRVIVFAPLTPTLHTHTLTVLTVCRSGSMSWTDGHTDQQRPVQHESSKTLLSVFWLAWSRGTYISLQTARSPVPVRERTGVAGFVLVGALMGGSQMMFPFLSLSKKN